MSNDLDGRLAATEQASQALITRLRRTPARWRWFWENRAMRDDLAQTLETQQETLRIAHREVQRLRRG